MDTTAIVIIALFALIVIAVILAFRQQIEVTIKGIFGTGLDVKASNPSPSTRPAVRVRDARSREGGLSAEDRTGRGVDLEEIDTRDDILATSELPESETNPKP